MGTKRNGSIIAGGALALMLTLGTGAFAQGTGDGTGDGSGDTTSTTLTTGTTIDTTATTVSVSGTSGDTSRSLATTGQDDAVILLGGGAALGLAVGARRFLRARPTR